MRVPLFLIPKIFAKKKLEQILADDLLKRFREPLSFLITNQVSEENQQLVDKVERLRSQLFANSEKLVGVHQSPEYDSLKFTSSVETRLQPTPLRQIPLSRIATNTSIHRYWGTFLYLCANAAGARTILELGSCGGISGSYLASGKSCERFITVEGSPDLAPIAEGNIRQITNRCEVMNTSFDTALDKIFETLESGLDLVYIDGQHEKDATLHYFERVIPHLNKGAVVLFDDIYWSEGMTDAWNEVGRWKGCARAVDLGRLGLCVWGGGAAQPKRYSFRAFTDHWGKGHSS